jgi:branched-subunit amino acid transport protein
MPQGHATMSTTSTVTERAAVAAVFVATIGIEPQVLWWACIGTAAGGLLSRPAKTKQQQTAWVGLLKFVVGSLLAALVGTYVGQAHMDQQTLSANTVAALLAAFLQPLFTAAGDAIPRAVDGLLVKLGLARRNGDQP